VIFNRAMPAWQPRCRGSQRLSLVRELGGSIDSEAAITRALKYLKSSQNADGSWGTVSRAGTTALVLLAMLGRCETPESILYGDEVMKSMMFLIELSRKKSPGYALAEQDAAYSAIEHGMVACALGEAYQSARLGSKSLPGLREAFEGAIKTTLAHQLPGGGWAGRTSGQGFRLPSEGPGMMIVTAWQAMALHTAKRSGLKFDGLQSSLDRIVDYTAGLTAQDGGIGNASDPWEGMNPAKITGAGVHVYQLLGPKRQAAVKRGVQYALDHLQGLTWETAELHTLLFTAQACRHQGGKDWAEFQRRVIPVLLSKQSWNASWTNDAKLISGSTSCTTALCVLILESYYRVPGATRQ